MPKAIGIIAGSIWTIGLMMAALWLWQNAAVLAPGADRVDSFYAIRCAAVAAGSAAQAVLLATVVFQLYRPDWISLSLGGVAAVGFTVGLIGAVAMAASA
jgi:hypothetical protein